MSFMNNDHVVSNNDTMLPSSVMFSGFDILMEVCTVKKERKRVQFSLIFFGGTIILTKEVVNASLDASPISINEAKYAVLF